MGDWRPNPDSTSAVRWLHDPTLPTPITASDYDPSATRLGLPVVPAGAVDFAGSRDYYDPRTFTHADGSVYQRPDPDEFPDFNDVDSTMIVDDGGPGG